MQDTTTCKVVNAPPEAAHKLSELTSHADTAYSFIEQPHEVSRIVKQKDNTGNNTAYGMLLVAAYSPVSITRG